MLIPAAAFLSVASFLFFKMDAQELTQDVGGLCFPCSYAEMKKWGDDCTETGILGNHFDCKRSVLGTFFNLPYYVVQIQFQNRKHQFTEIVIDRSYLSSIDLLNDLDRHLDSAGWKHENFFRTKIVEWKEDPYKRGGWRQGEIRVISRTDYTIPSSQIVVSLIYPPADLAKVIIRRKDAARWDMLGREK